MDKDTGRQTETQRQKHTNKETGRETETETDKYRGRQTEKYGERERDDGMLTVAVPLVNSSQTKRLERKAEQFPEMKT